MRCSLPANADGTPSADKPMLAATDDPTSEQLPRRMRIEKRDLDTLWYTQGRPGGYATKHRRPHKAHTERCRTLTYSKLKDRPEYAERLAASENRENRFIEKSLIDKYGAAPEAEPPRIDPPGGSASSSPAAVPGNTNTTPTNDNNHDDIHFGRLVDAEMGIHMEDIGFLYNDADINTAQHDVVNAINDSLDMHIKYISETDPKLMRHMMNDINKQLALHVRTNMPSPMLNSALLIPIYMLANDLGRPNIAEIYCPPRATSLANTFGFVPGLALDLSVLDPTDGLPWDFSLAHKRERARTLPEQEAQFLLMLSPMCKAFPTLTNLNTERVGLEKWAAMQGGGQDPCKMPLGSLQRADDTTAILSF